jgi:hypothetical protein
MKQKLLLSFIVLTLCCKIGNAQLRTYTVLPSQTDNAIDTYTNPGDEHYVYVNDSAKKLNKLFLFLPGTNGRGKNAKFVVPYAAAVGYHAISLTYCADLALAMICKKSSDSSCFANGRQELIFGDDVSKAWTVNKANSIVNRLQKLLLYLAATYPNDNWKQFLTADNDINWQKICVAGQSQGGGHAAYIAQQKKVDRVIMFASPKDYSNTFNQPAFWLKQKSVTPLNRYFGFVHTADETNGCTWPQQKVIFTTMGFDALGKWINTDEVMPPYGHTHTLTSTKPQGFPHGAVIGDKNYETVWRYMMLEEMEQ